MFAINIYYSIDVLDNNNLIDTSIYYNRRKSKMAENIVQRSAITQYKKDYKEYADYLEKHRTVPEFRDGFKPVQRRLIYTSKFEIHCDDKRVKCADIVGRTMGMYHPHGDSSIEGALYTMINWFQTKVPLFDGQGNFGNTYQNVPAASRYTEAKLSKFARECIVDELASCADIVDYENNYDNSRKEPSFLPCKVPLLLVNGCMGISVGEKTDMSSHNLNEVIDATINLIKNPRARVVLIPDHCQCCEIVDTDWASICNKGYGHYKARGIIDIEPYSGVEKRYNGLDTLVIKSCPNMTFLEKVIDKIHQMIKENKIIGIQDMEEQSEKNMRYVIVLKPGTDPQYIRNEIYKNTQMMQTFRINFKVLDNTDKEHPSKRMSYKQYLQAWIEFRKMTKLRLYEHKLQKYLTRLHIVEMYVMAMEKGISDKIITIIRKYKGTDDIELMETLIKKLNLTDIQAKFFINCELKKLGQGYYASFKKEQKKLNDDIKELSDIVLIDGAIEQKIIEELLEVKKTFGEPRKCKIISENEINGIASGIFKVVLTDTGFIKKIGVNDPILKGKNGNVKFVIDGDNSKDILLFDELGHVFDLPISKIPFGDKSTSGVDIRILNKNINSNITTVIYQPIMEQYNKGYVVTLTKNGFVKRMTTTDFLSVPASGIIYCKLDGDDKIVDMLLFNNNAEIVVYGSKKALRIDINDIPILKRNSRGCVSMSSKTTNVEGMSVIERSFKDIIIVTKNGYINRIIPDSVVKGRSKAGSNVIKLGKTDNIVSIIGINNNDILSIQLLTGEIIDVPVSTVANGSTISTGVKMIKGGEVVKVFKKIL